MGHGSREQLPETGHLKAAVNEIKFVTVLGHTAFKLYQTQNNMLGS